MTREIPVESTHWADIDPSTLVGFLRALDRLNDAMLAADSPDDVLPRVLDTVLEVLDCDRAWLVFPCDPDAETWRVEIERTRPEYPGAFESGEEFPLDDELAEHWRGILRTREPFAGQLMPGEPRWDPEDRYRVRAHMDMAIFPKLGPPWQFGIHQCSSARVWTTNERRLFQEVGRRIADGLSNLLFLRDLRERERSYRNLVEILPNGVLIVTPDGSISYANPAAREILEASRGRELSRDHIASYVAPRAATEGPAPLAESLRAERTPFQVQERILRPDGHIAVVEIGGRSVEVRGRPAWMLSLRDVSERVRARRAADENHALLKGVMEQCPVPIIVMDRDRRLTYNRACERHFHAEGSPVFYQGVPYDAVPEFVVFLDADGVRVPRTSLPLARAFLAREATEARQLRLVLPDGTQRWESVFAAPIEAEDGELLAAVAVFPDITEQKRSEETLRAIADYTYDWESWLGSDGRLMWTNPAVERATGYDVAACLAMEDYPLPIIHPEDRSRIGALLKRAIRERTSVNDLEFRAVAKDGAIRHMAIAWQPVFDAQGVHIGLRTSARDISERRSAEEERQRLEEQLRRAQKLEAVGQLAGGVAHDFNNILTAVFGCADLALDALRGGRGQGDAVVPLVEELKSAAEKAARLTRQLLTFGRRSVRRVEVLDLNETVRGLQKMLRRLVRENVELRVRLAEELPTLEADAGQLEQVLVNLVVNAVQAMPDGGAVEIVTRRAAPGDADYPREIGLASGDLVQLTIRDDGHGMDADTLGRIFEPFFTTKKAEQGTGLGLATVHGIVAQSEGHIRVESEPGVGTTFDVFFPAVGLAARPSSPAPSVPRDASSTGGTILVCEDEPAVRKLTVQILRRAGYDVMSAGSAEEALRLMAASEEELVLLVTDVVLGGSSGRALSDRLRERDPRLPTLFVSGHTSGVVTHEGVQDTGMNFLEKPFGRGQLLERVRALLRRRARRR